MKRLTGAAALVFCVFFAVAATPSYGFETPVVSAKDHQFLENIGTVFLRVGKKFGCDQFAWANFVTPEKRALAFEYVPKGDHVENWTRLVTVTLFTLTGDPKIDHEIMDKLEGGLLGAYKSRGKIIATEFYHNNQTNDPAAFIEYDIGSGPLLEHNAGVFLRTGKVAAGFIQVQSRGKPLKPSDITGLKSLLGPIGGASTVPKPTSATPAAHK